MRTRYFKRTIAAAVLCFSTASLLLAGTLAAAHAHSEHGDDALTSICTLCSTAKVLPASTTAVTGPEPVWIALAAAAISAARLAAPNARADFEARAPPRF